MEVSATVLDDSDEDCWCDCTFTGEDHVISKSQRRKHRRKYQRRSRLGWSPLRNSPNIQQNTSTDTYNPPGDIPEVDMGGMESNDESISNKNSSAVVSDSNSGSEDDEDDEGEEDDELIYVGGYSDLESQGDGAGSESGDASVEEDDGMDEHNDMEWDINRLKALSGNS
jgi:hypothetical protein